MRTLYLRALSKKEALKQAPWATKVAKVGTFTYIAFESPEDYKGFLANRLKTH